MPNWNRELFDQIYGFAHRSLFLDSLAVFLAEPLTYFLVIGILFFIFARKNRKERWWLFGSFALAALLSRGIIAETFRFFYVHPRPVDLLNLDSLIEESSNSFPSGHASLLFALAGMLWYRARKWGWLCLGLALINGFARIYAGVHWPLDILGGIVVGLFSAWLVNLILPPAPSPEVGLEESALPGINSQNET